MQKKPSAFPLSWHREECPCKGRPQPVSKRLAARQKETPAAGSTGKMFYRKPGSQNRSK